MLHIAYWTYNILSSHRRQGELLLQVQDQGGSQLWHLAEATLGKALAQVLQQFQDTQVIVLLHSLKEGGC